MLITETTSRTICPLPFLHTYITANGSLVACCESQETILGSPSDTFKNNWNNDAYRNLRKSLIDGEQPQACTKCWDNEKLGILSNRQEAWSSFTKGFYGKKEIDTDDGLKIEQLPLAVELKCSNLCNLKCRMCHPESSHRISEDKEIIEKYRKGLPWPKNILSSQQTVQSLLSEGADYLSQIEVLQFSGGEPLISDEQYDLVQYLLKHNPEKVHLRYATNLTQLNYKSFDYPEVWKQFKRVNIKVSIDGIDDVYDYIRVGSSFNKVITNLYRLIDLNLPNVHLGIGFTTQAYNVFQLPEFLSFFEKLVPRNAITIYPLHAPKMMMISEIAPQYRERILHKLKSQRSDLEPIINIIQQSNADSSSWNQLLKYTDELEKKWHVKNGFQHLLEKYLEGY